jgi:hypothetical protein
MSLTLSLSLSLVPPPPVIPTPPFPAHQISEALRQRSDRLRATEEAMDKQSRDSAAALHALQSKLDRLKATREEQQHGAQAAVS